MQKQIIPQLFHKINPYFKNFSVFSGDSFAIGRCRAAARVPPARTAPNANCQRQPAGAVKGQNQQNGLSNLGEANPSAFCTICRISAICVMLTQNAYPHSFHTPAGLWITLVDKHVENVENYELSTVISPVQFSPGLVKKLYKSMHNRRRRISYNWVTATLRL